MTLEDEFEMSLQLGDAEDEIKRLKARVAELENEIATDAGWITLLESRIEGYLNRSPAP